ncbi:hypothetical protein [Frankia nepalensis]|uniref:Uncharacterized protein n=1 Tax=Frankia nepalensis TaxID=1836974 RepID=A0A937RE82_9ACTN|nr:hypothetical protein [Frankia nepalensis]MBL7501805.1 hypothetical protein [Frankia nepalensis]MBL7516459.1 hypothetical protein [Frankia nepalensis]MBL7625824.1 hypothetical protein [Frankia nepalensis]
MTFEARPRPPAQSGSVSTPAFARRRPARRPAARRGWRPRVAAAAGLVAAVAAAGCGPLAPVVDEAMNPSMDAFDTCCRGVDRAGFARLAGADARIVDLPADGGALAADDYVIRVTAVATTPRLGAGAVPAGGWTAGEPILEADTEHDLVLALVTFTCRTGSPDCPAPTDEATAGNVPAVASTQADRPASTPPKIPNNGFYLSTLVPETLAGTSENIALFVPETARPGDSVVVVTRVLRAAHLTLYPYGDYWGVSLRDGEPATD